ncbi:DNA polymerase III, delta' subunit [Legionella lansingensis]|uniref:DNA polymerase III subunit delta' n=1 Tax=Legionella lansingensis TaxID=45067 RepID=A0A0W0VQH2_9GAMM|nr:DNA polymerase III subunit delta' [Legionella lansingensis]KTD22312.1 DNA polymerase III, delta' subunit [Legionella lansingensis]SNV50725.1 DNA polymerase III, delta' subunit [Legionella lansingensis]
MQLLKPSELAKDYTAWWDRFCSMYENQRLPHALLLIGHQSAHIVDFTYKMAAAILCTHEKKPCGECKSCRLLTLKEHPDFYYVQPEKTGGMIKIDQIRDLQTIAFTSPQLGRQRLIVIGPAEKMNPAAANALLKLLEEPPSTIMFVLIAEQISTILPTILSRCQQWRFSFAEILEADYLTIGESYTETSVRGEIFKQHPIIIQDLLDVMNGHTSVCALATKWTKHEFGDLIWLLYLLNSQMLYYQLVGFNSEKNGSSSLYDLSKYFKPPALFSQLDELNAIMRKLNQNISVNQTLILENFLFNFVLNLQV